MQGNLTWVEQPASMGYLDTIYPPYLFLCVGVFSIFLTCGCVCGISLSLFYIFWWFLCSCLVRESLVCGCRMRASWCFFGFFYSSLLKGSETWVFISCFFVFCLLFILLLFLSVLFVVFDMLFCFCLLLVFYCLGFLGFDFISPSCNWCFFFLGMANEFLSYFFLFLFAPQLIPASFCLFRVSLDGTRQKNRRRNNSLLRRDFLMKGFFYF